MRHDFGSPATHLLHVSLVKLPTCKFTKTELSRCIPALAESLYRYTMIIEQDPQRTCRELLSWNIIQMYMRIWVFTMLQSLCYCALVHETSPWMKETYYIALREQRHCNYPLGQTISLRVIKLHWVQLGFQGFFCRVDTNIIKGCWHPWQHVTFAIKNVHAHKCVVQCGPKSSANVEEK